MARLLLTWIGFTVLQLGAPSGPSVAAFRPGGVMSFGITVGTLSSIFVASPVLLWLTPSGDCS